MKTRKILLFLSVALFISNISLGQNNGRRFAEILQSYYLYKDKDIVETTIDFVNKTTTDYNRLSPMLVGFFGALFLSDQELTMKFKANFDKIEKPAIKTLLISLTTLNIDSIYAQAESSTQLNDLNWASFFATGNTKYIDNIIKCVPDCDNRTNLNLFLAGASAKWSLCSNSSQHKLVKTHLELQQEKSDHIKEILSKSPQYFQEEMVAIIREQKAKGVWK